MKNFIEVMGVNEKFNYAININSICRFYPIDTDDKDFIKTLYDDKKINQLSSLVSEDALKSINDTRNSIEKANCIIELNILNTLNDEAHIVYTTNTYDEIKMKIENAQ